MPKGATGTEHKTCHPHQMSETTNQGRRAHCHPRPKALRNKKSTPKISIAASARPRPWVKKSGSANVAARPIRSSWRDREFDKCITHANAAPGFQTQARLKKRGTHRGTMHCVLVCWRPRHSKGNLALNTDTISIKGLARPVSRIALGTWAIGGWMWGGPDDENAIKTIHRALDDGIDLIDTAPVYGFGHSEEVIGRALKGKRDKAVIATKVGLNWTNDHKPFRDSRPSRIRQEVEDSLKRLKTDYIDLEQVHWPDGRTPVDETARELEKLHKEGKILAIGVSNFSVADMDIFREIAPISTIQPPYNLFERGTEREILPYAKAHEAVVLAYGPLCRGLLAGKMTSATTFPKDDLRSNDPKFQAPNFEHYLAAVDELRAIAEKHGKTMLSLAIRWVLDQGPTIALWGARKPEQIDGVRDAFGWTLNDVEKAEIDAILKRHVPNPIEPEFMAPPQRA